MQFESHLGHVFSLFRGGWPLSVNKLFIWGPAPAGRFSLVAGDVAVCLLSYVVDHSGLCYFFMDAFGVYNMTLRIAGGDVPLGGACCYRAGSSYPFISCGLEDDTTK
jgi:hypothetical protein